MIRVMLVDERGHKSYLHCNPPHGGDHRSYARGRQERALPETAGEISQQLAKGQISGWIGGCRWYRQAGN
jgi:hypothetical protein